MSNFIMSKRSFLFGMVAAPAVIVAERLMPVRTIEAISATADVDKWILGQFDGSPNPVWMRMSSYLEYSGTAKVLRRINLPFEIVKPKNRLGWEVQKLTGIQQATVITSELPMILHKPTLRDLDMRSQLVHGVELPHHSRHSPPRPGLILGA